MPGVPMDPYSDQPLRMGSVAGKPVIYSVGPDGKDDKAQVEWNLARTSRAISSSDLKRRRNDGGCV